MTVANRLARAFLAAVLVVGLLPVLPAALVQDQARMAWAEDKTPDTSWYDSASSEFTLATPEQLVGLASLVNNGTDSFAGKTVSLGADIDLAGWSWEPLGTYVRYPAGGTVALATLFQESKPFCGTFDGCGHVIRGVNVSASDYSAFFGCIDGATVKDLQVNGTSTSEGACAAGLVCIARNATISGCMNLVAVSAQSATSVAGGVLYLSYGATTVTDCANFAPVAAGNTAYGIASTASLSGCTLSVERCSNYGTVSGGYAYGIACVGSVNACANHGAVAASGMFGAGVGGGAISNCYNDGSVISVRTNGDMYDKAAGIADPNASAVANCYNVGVVSGQALFKGTDPFGSFPVVSPRYKSQSYLYAMVTNCYYLDSCVADPAPATQPYKGEAMTADQMKSSSFAETLGSEFVFDEGSYPVLAWESQQLLPQESFSLRIGADSGGSLSVKRDGQALANGAQVKGGDILEIVATPNEGYEISGKLDLSGLTSLGDALYRVDYYQASTPRVSVKFKGDPESYDWNSKTWAGGLDFTWYDENDRKAEYHLSTPAQWEAMAWICSEHLGELVDDQGAFTIGEDSFTCGNITAIRGTVPTNQFTFAGVKVYLDCDIDMGGVRDPETGAWSGPNYYPVGGQVASDRGGTGDQRIFGVFYGNFDGQGHVVKNLYCSRPSDYAAAADGSQAIGLFGRIGQNNEEYGGVCDNDVVIENVAVTGYILGYRMTGGVVGKTGTVTEGHTITIRNCINFASIEEHGGAKGIAGVVGAAWNGPVIENCANFGSILGDYASCNAAGVVGASEAASVSNCYNVGLVTNPANASNAGAVALNKIGGLPVTNCYALEGSCPGYTMSVVNRLESDTGTTTGGWLSADQMRSANFAATLSAGTSWVVPRSDEAMYQIMDQLGYAGYPVPAAFAEGEALPTYQVTFDTTPSGAQVTVYSDAACTQVVAPDEGGVYSLELGSYWYRAQAQGYATAQGSFSALGEGSAIVVPVSLNALVEVSFSIAPSTAALLVRDAAGSELSPKAAGSSVYVLEEGVEYSWSASLAGYLPQKGTVVATAGAVVDVALEGVPEGYVTGGMTIYEDGVYNLAPGATGLITLAEEIDVTLVGGGADAENRFNDLHIVVGDSTKLTLRDVYIELTTKNVPAAVDFLGLGELGIEGECLINRANNVETSKVFPAIIHVGPDADVTLGGTGTLYGYKYSLGTYIGANAYQDDASHPNSEANGRIKIVSGNWYLKGSQTGAVIGNDSSTQLGGQVEIAGGEVHVKTVSQAAGIGASRLGWGCPVVISGGLVEILTDFSGSAIGFGGGKAGDPGSLTVTGGSLRTVVTPNAYSAWGVEKPVSAGSLATTANITASFDTAQLVFDTSAYAGKDSIELKVDGEVFYAGAPSYTKVTNELKNPSGLTGTTRDNWLDNDVEWLLDEGAERDAGGYPIEDGSTLAGTSALYLHLSKADHEITVGRDRYQATWDAETGTFELSEAPSMPEGATLGDVNNSGRVNIVDAQIAYDLGAGRYAADGDAMAALLARWAEGTTLAQVLCVADANADGTVDAADAFAIQHAVHHGGAFGSVTD